MHSPRTLALRAAKMTRLVMIQPPHSLFSAVTGKPARSSAPSARIRCHLSTSMTSSSELEETKTTHDGASSVFTNGNELNNDDDQQKRVNCTSGPSRYGEGYWSFSMPSFIAQAGQTATHCLILFFSCKSSLVSNSSLSRGICCRRERLLLFHVSVE